MILFDFSLLFISALGHVMTLTNPNRSIEWPDAPRTIKNEFSVKKYVGSVVLKSFQLQLVAEIGPSANSMPNSNFYTKFKDFKLIV